MKLIFTLKNSNVKLIKLQKTNMLTEKKIISRRRGQNPENRALRYTYEVLAWLWARFDLFEDESKGIM